MSGKGLFGNTLSVLQQGLDAVDVITNLVHARTEYGTFNLYHIRIAGDDGVDADRVVVGHAERCHVELVDIMYGVLAARLANNTYRLAVGVTRESTGVVDQRAHTLCRLHLVIHGALYLTGHINQTVVGTHHDDVVVTQTDIAAELAVEDIVVDVDGADQTIVAIDLDVTQGTNIVRTTSHIQGMEHRGKGGQCVGTRGLHLTHHVDGDGACLTY